MKWRWCGVFALLVVVAISYADRTNTSVLITDRTFTDHFGITGDRAAQGALMTVFLIGYALASLLITPLYEVLLGVRRGLVVSLVSWSLCTVVSPYASGAVMLLGLRLLLGAGEGPLFSLKTMYVNDAFTEQTRGKPNAVTSMGVSLGTALGMPLVTFALEYLGWRGSFLVLAGLNVLIGVPLVLLFVRGGARPRSGVPMRQWLRTALRTPNLAWVLLVEIATLGYLWGSSSWLPSYLLQERHFSVAQMGVLSALPFLVSLASGFAGGFALDRLVPRRAPLVLAVGSVGTALSVTAVVFVEARWMAALGLIVANGFWGLQGPAIPTLVQRYSHPGAVGTAYGLVNGVGNLFAAGLPAAMGFVIGVSGQGFAAGYVLLAATQVVTLFGAIMLLLREKRTIPPETSGNDKNAAGYRHRPEHGGARVASHDADVE